jgi:superfamily II DNA or RNA helicase
VIVDSWLRVHRDEADIEELKSRHIVRNPEYTKAVKMGHNTDGIKEWEPMWEMDGNYLLLPRGVANTYLKSPNHILDDQTTLGFSQMDFKSKIKPRPNQVTFIDNLLGATYKTYGALGMAEPGFGKTVCTLQVIAELKRPALIVVHKGFLMNQWKERILEYYDIPEDEVGIVQQGTCQYKGKKIVVAMAQSLLSRTYPPDFYTYFGTLAVDEVHRFAAPTFRQTIVMFPARYRIGVTATPNRTDGLQKVFESHIGKIQAIGEKRKIKPEIVQIPADFKVPSEKPFKDYNGRVNLTKVVSAIVESDTYNRQIARMAVKAADAGRKLIIFSDRIKHLEKLEEVINAELGKQGKRFTVGYYIGGMKEEALAISATRNILLASFAMAQEGLDIPELDTCFLCTPKADIEQTVGRITREHDDKKNPMVIDFVHSVSICMGMAKKRLKQYKKLGWIE